MRIVLFCHSILSDWKHENAHFLRGVSSELIWRGHEVNVYEPKDGWSLKHLREEQGEEAVQQFHEAYPSLRSYLFETESLDLESALGGADVVLVHEWTDPALVKRIGEHKASSKRDYKLLFYDTHHRAMTDRESMARYDLTHYDGVLASGEVLREIYLRQGWTQNAWTWHEAADTHRFRPSLAEEKWGDLVWIGNWGGDERTADLQEFLLGPIKRLGLKARVYGAGYPQEALDVLADAGIEYGGWLPNFRVPEIYSHYRVTVHVPRRPYVEALPSIPTMRLFEALACGIPLVSAPWNDSESLFIPGYDYLVARDGQEMESHLRAVLSDPELERSLFANGVRTVLSAHTCAHRVDQLLEIYDVLTEGGGRALYVHGATGPLDSASRYASYQSALESTIVYRLHTNEVTNA